MERDQPAQWMGGARAAVHLSESTADGIPLAHQVGFVISTDVGRFPFLNEYRGEDHFPEYPVILMGPGLRAGQYGRTDRNMVSTPISLQTGRSSSSAKDVIPTLEDVGTTVLQWFGIDDTESVGYVGRRLDFLLT
jgi:hypothetical protein